MHRVGFGPPAPVAGATPVDALVDYGLPRTRLQDASKTS
jgi:hypothetical protein